MAETRTTLTLYPATTEFLSGGRCRAAGDSLSKRLDLLAARYATIMDNALAPRDKLTAAEWVAIERAASDLAFTRAEDALLLPAVLKLAARRRGTVPNSEEGKALSGASFKIDQAAPAGLFAVADALERFRYIEPNAANRTPERFAAFAQERGLDLTPPQGA